MLSDSLKTFLIGEAERAYPRECCGVLLAEPGGRVVEAMPLMNASAGERRFEIPAAELELAEAEARARGLRLAAIYHSHPDGEAALSEEDRRNAVPWLDSVVVAVPGGRVKVFSRPLPSV